MGGVVKPKAYKRRAGMGSVKQNEVGALFRFVVSVWCFYVGLSVGKPQKDSALIEIPNSDRFGVLMSQIGERSPFRLGLFHLGFD